MTLTTKTKASEVKIGDTFNAAGAITGEVTSIRETNSFFFFSVNLAEGEIKWSNIYQVRKTATFIKS